MSDADADAPHPRRRQWRRWIWRSLAGLGFLILVLVLFHRPLAHWAIRHLGSRLAANAGLDASWISTGTVWGDLAFKDVRITGDEGSTLRSLTAGHAAVEYDPWRFRTEGAGAMVDRIVVRRLKAEFDFTQPARQRSRRESSRRSQGAGGFPSIRIPVVEIEQASFRFRLPAGVIEIDDLSLTLAPANPGSLKVARLSIPGLPEMQEVQAATRATEDSVTLENLMLWPEVELERLAVQLADLSAGKIGFEAAVRQGPASASTKGFVVLGGVDGPVVQAEAEARQVSSQTLAFWKVPDGGVDWNAGEVALSARGPALRPDRMAAFLRVRGATVSHTDYPVATVSATALLNAGELQLSELKAGAGFATANATASFSMPASWAAIAESGGNAQLDLQLPHVEEWLPPESGVGGPVFARLEASVAQRALTGVTATLRGESLEIAGLPTRAVNAVITTTEGHEWKVQADARLTEENSVQLTGFLDTRADQSFEAAWTVECRDLASVPLPESSEIPWPHEGSISSRGSVAGSIAAVRAKEWAGFNGMAEVKAAGVKMRDASMDSLTADLEAGGGAVQMNTLSVRFDPENSVSATGRLEEANGSYRFAARTQASLAAVQRLTGWSTSFGGPALRGGAIRAEWEGNGGEDLLSLTGSGSVVVDRLAIEGFPESLGGEAILTHSGNTLSLTSLKATAGPWRASTTGSWDGERVEIPEFTAWLNDRRLAVASLSLPLTRAPSKEGSPPIDPEAPVKASVLVENVDVGQLGDDLKQEWPVRGFISAEAELSGTLRELAATVDVSGTGLAPAEGKTITTEPASATMKAVLREGRLTVDGRVVQKPLAPIRVEGNASGIDLPAILQDAGSLKNIPVNGRLQLPSSSLAFLPQWIPQVQSVRGTASVDVTLTGTMGEPKWQGGAQVRVPEARLTGESLPSVRDLTLRIRADEKRLSIDEARVLLAGGRLRLQGGADLAKPTDPQLDLRVQADEVLVVRDEDLSLRANAALVCQGPLSQAAVTGTIHFVRGRVFKEVEFLPLSLPNQLPPPPPPTALKRQGPPALPSPLDAWTFDVAIGTRDPIRLMGNVVRGSVVTDMRLRGTGAAPVLTGQATTQQMWVKLPFSRLNITEGTMTFTEDQPFDPTINVVGESITDGRTVQVFVHGRALDPKVRLTSSPPLPEGEIAALLATGVTTGDLATRSGEAAGRAAFVVLQQAYRKMFPKRAKRLDDAEPPRLSFEFSIFGSDSSRRSLSAIYSLNPQWRIIGRVGEAGTFRGLLHYLIRFR